MTDARPVAGAEVLEHRGYQIHLSPGGLEWMACVALSKQRPILIMALDREAALAKAREWIDRPLASDRNPK
ncbi:hypothetical protein BB934_31265 (plasmid) [Microvirga ossetica]|uniref:Uncharacterized protein n=1 Tax=Microvirga ossetica TaxID=1882682 RepID=A0A1B2ERY5_9HYPH|nr:hypothetical protein [Microvirga ossetica]ANY82736.1 hypothetical protein BB934_31265 [Microvirga ossetica]